MLPLLSFSRRHLTCWLQIVLLLGRYVVINKTLSLPKAQIQESTVVTLFSYPVLSRLLVS